MKDKFILDACCGPRHFWFDKHHPNCIYIDKRVEEKGFIENRPNREVKPDIVMDFRDLKFKDKSFKLIIMDPPHLKSNKPVEEHTGTLIQSYGCLNPDTWKEDIKRGFDECWRVLEDYGVLIFKWNESNIKKRVILEVLNKEPLFGQHPQGKVATMWLCFMKIPN